MFEVIFRVICDNDGDEVKGKEGFFQINCNGNTYGDIYPEELEGVMDKVCVYDWFERLLRVTKELQRHSYVVLSDTESCNRWIEFVRNSGDRVTVSIIKSNKVSGSQDIEYTRFNDKKYVEWDNQEVNYIALREEVIAKAQQYVERLLIENDNTANQEIQKLNELIAQVQGDGSPDCFGNNV